MWIVIGIKIMGEST